MVMPDHTPWAKIHIWPWKFPHIPRCTHLSRYSAGYGNCPGCWPELMAQAPGAMITNKVIMIVVIQNFFITLPPSFAFKNLFKEQLPLLIKKRRQQTKKLIFTSFVDFYEKIAFLFVLFTYTLLR
jgi:hypothetical protein